MAVADTIAAIATPAGKGAIGAVRVSGPAVRDIMQALFGGALPARRAQLADFKDAAGAAIDRGIALYFPAPASYTGEDVLELQGHGGPVVLALVLARCIELGARPAEPGEFTRRAFLNDKLDLAQAEAVADLIDAATQQAARSAARSLSGEFSRRVEALQAMLTELRVLIEASFDFAEEEVDVLTETGAAMKLTHLQAALAHTLAAAHQGRLLTSGLTVVLAGPPNVGKSSIFNILSSDDVAIVTPVPGTTRDLVRSTISIRGMPVHLIDSAGLRSTADPVERIGVERARDAARQADIVLAISSADAMPSMQGEECTLSPAGRVVHVHNKIDLAGLPARRETVDGQEHVWISARFGTGLELLSDALVAAAGGGAPVEDAFSARQRHIDALQAVAGHVGAAAAAISAPEFAAEELRLAQEALSRLTGSQVADDLLGEIFARFCIGK